MQTLHIRRAATLAAAAVCLAAWPALAQPQHSAPPSLAGTSWRLVSVRAGGNLPLIPADETNYTLDFQADGRLRARVDCNGGRGRWSSSAPGAIEFGPLGLTRETCKPGSLQQRFVADWRSIRGYSIKAHHLFLATGTGSALYEFRPLPPKEPVTTAVASVGPFTYDCTEPGNRAGVVQATFYQTQPAMVLVEREGRTRPAFAVPAASGTKFLGADLVFGDLGGQASVVWSGVTLECRRQ